MEERGNGAGAPTQILAASWFANEGSRSRQSKGSKGRNPGLIQRSELDAQGPDWEAG